VLKEKIWANLHRIIELFHKKIVKKLLNYGLGIRKKPIPGPVSRGQKGTGSWIPDPDPQHWPGQYKCSLLYSFKTGYIVYLLESVSFVDNFGAAGGKILVTELGKVSGPGLDVDGETLHQTTQLKRGSTSEIKYVSTPYQKRSKPF